MENDAVENKKDSSFKKFLDDTTDIIESVIFSIFIVLLIFTYLFRISDVSGPSMLPTLHDDDRVVISSLFYELKQNDIVIVDSSALDKLIVKRVIGMSGQSVDIDFETGIVSVDGTPLDEQLYVSGSDGSEPELTADHFVNTLTTINMGAFDTYPVIVPQGYVFVLGDNRNQSKDSKHAELGFVPEDEIVGKVVYRIFPFDKLGTVK
ncbi:MAG: signal peptidase I [Oscillospiraceae bacterium]|nr:signal peptidase I [Oscillospiraceae bacterium]